MEDQKTQFFLDGAELLPVQSQTIDLPKRASDRAKLTVETRRPSLLRNMSAVSSSLEKEPFSNINDILKFPIESTHAYSYAHLLPNSLALRLNVLKRSLQILKERPTLFKAMSFQGEEPQELPKPRHSISGETKPSPLYTNPLANNSGELLDRYKLQNNASSAALAAFFKSSSLKRLESTPVSAPAKPPSEKEDSEIHDIIDLLDNEALADNTEIASSLHNLLLSSNTSKNHLKNKLLYALATPFIETSLLMSAQPSLTPVNSLTPMGSSLSMGQTLSMARTFSTVALSSLLPSIPSTPTTANGRPFHAILSGKHAVPQSVFTVEVDSPWCLKAANDLACLMFGVSKNTIRSLTLMDLIAPQFRNFVTERLLRLTNDILTFKSRNQERSASNNILFAGEIVAIARPGDSRFAWTSMWAKRKGLLIIIMFDQIPCDAFDVVISCLREKYPEEFYLVDSISEIAGKLIGLRAKEIHDISSISETVDQHLRAQGSEEGAQDVVDSEKINRTRYYTLSLHDNENIPCAVTSNPLEIHQDRYEIKLKFHTLPYIAGIFVLRALDLKILSCNNAIAKNLFGRSFDQLTENSIDYIIPNFSAILSLGLEDSEALSVVPGLVLPEHFFRKYDAILRFEDEDLENEDLRESKTEEELFLSSHGIEGRHRDGKPIFVDVQLRVSANDTYVLWVTYSRHNFKKDTLSRELDKLTTPRLAPSQTSSPALPNKHTSSSNMPSQLNLLPDNESDLLELGYSSNEVSRSSSTRRPKANTFAIPVSELSTAFTGSEAKSRPPTAKPSHHASDAVYTKFSEEEVLRIENEQLQQKIDTSSQWPSKIGAKKRSKKFAEFKVLKDMGEGAYGKVVLAQHKEDPVYKIIIKCIDKERILVDTWVRDRSLGTIPSEIQIMAFLNNEPHPNIMRIIDYFEDPKYFYLETPIFGNPPAIDLFDYIEIKKNLSELECQFIFKQIVLAIYHLHKHGIVHRDIKDENVIVDEHGIIKLIDFGSAGYTKLGPFDVFVGTIDYASPEVLRGEKYEGKPQDIWALGILLYTLLYKENPFYNVDEIMEGDLNVPYVVSEPSVKLIKRILVRDIATRPTITDIAEDEWLNI